MSLPVRKKVKALQSQYPYIRQQVHKTYLQTISIQQSE